jgi:hypothetical protein
MQAISVAQDLYVLQENALTRLHRIIKSVRIMRVQLFQVLVLMHVVLILIVLAVLVEHVFRQVIVSRDWFVLIMYVSFRLQ